MTQPRALAASTVAEHRTATSLTASGSLERGRFGGALLEAEEQRGPRCDPGRARGVVATCRMSSPHPHSNRRPFTRAVTIPRRVHVDVRQAGRLLRRARDAPPEPASHPGDRDAAIQQDGDVPRDPSLSHLRWHARAHGSPGTRDSLGGCSLHLGNASVDGDLADLPHGPCLDLEHRSVDNHLTAADAVGWRGGQGCPELVAGVEVVGRVGAVMESSQPTVEAAGSAAHGQVPTPSMCRW